jgi:hypothetical protein
MIGFQFATVVNFIFWFVVYTIATYAACRVFNVDARVLSPSGGFVTTLLDAAINSSSSGPFSGFQLLPIPIAESQAPATPVPPYLVSAILIVLIFVVIYAISQRS